MWLALAGFVLSALLELLHVRAYTAPAATSFCALGPRLDCTSVALSPSSVFVGLPLPIWGMLGFSALGLAAWLGSAWLLPLALFAALASLALLGVEIAHLRTLCLLCEGVHGVSLALGVVAFRARRSLASFADRDHAALVLLPPLGAMLAALLFLRPYWRTVTFRGELPFVDGVTADGAHWLGAAAPKLTVEEYTDYLCPHCAAASAWTLRRVAARPNDIRLVRRQQPRARCTLAHGSCERLRFAYCAEEQARFWQMDRWLFAHGEDRSVSASAAASELGLDLPRFAGCIESTASYAHAVRDSDAASRRRFIGTPSYVVNGKRTPPETAARFLTRGRAD